MICALAWALSRSSRLTRLTCAPGNGGTARHAENVDISAEDVDGLVAHAVERRYDLVVVGTHGEVVPGWSRSQTNGEPGALPGHGLELVEDVLRIPLIVRWPEGTKGRRIDAAWVSTTDVAPTILDLAGVPEPPWTGQAYHRPAGCQVA